MLQRQIGRWRFRYRKFHGRGHQIPIGTLYSGLHPISIIVLESVWGKNRFASSERQPFLGPNHLLSIYFNG